MRDLLERRLDAATDHMNGTDSSVLAEYCTVLTSAAEELELGKFESFSVADIQNQFQSVRTEIVTLATKLSMRHATKNIENSVALPRTTKTKIFAQIERLRGMVSAADLPERQKKRLFDKLDEFHSLVVAPRTDFAKLMIILAAFSSIGSDAVRLLVDAPIAIENIWKMVGEAIEGEHEEQRLLEEAGKPLQIADQRPRNNLDDEIPF